MPGWLGLEEDYLRIRHREKLRRRKPGSDEVLRVPSCTLQLHPESLQCPSPQDVRPQSRARTTKTARRAKYLTQLDVLTPNELSRQRILGDVYQVFVFGWTAVLDSQAME